MSEPPRIIAEPSQLTEFYWQLAAAGVVALQRCLDCGQVWHPAAPTCPNSPQHAIEWFAACGRGRLYSYTRVEHAAHRSVADRLPYLIALVELVEGPRFVCNLLDAQESELTPGLPVEISLGTAVGGQALPVARPSLRADRPAP